MKKSFNDLLQIARDNARNNPSTKTMEDREVALHYLEGLRDEIAEVEAEIKEQNEVYLIDELSDIAWDYANLISVLEERGYVTNGEDVLDHAHSKYAERTPAFKIGSDVLWKEIKDRQKEILKQRHRGKYE